MALEDADIEKITEIIKTTVTGIVGEKDGGAKDKDADEIARIKAEAERQAQNASALKSALSFNLSRDAFLKDNDKYLPATIATVIKGLAGRTFKDDVEQADTYRKIILDEIFDDLKNIEIMPSSAKDKIASYKGMADTDRVAQSGKFYELVDTFLALKKGMAQKEFNNKGSDNSDDPYMARFAKLGEIYTKKGA